MKFDTYKSRVNLGVSIFLVWVLVQFFRATFGGEPYPAIYLPGFSANGSENLESRELYVKKGQEFVLITHDDAPFGYARFTKLLRQFSKYFESGDEDKLRAHVNVIIDLNGIEEGDSIRIDQVIWQPASGTYVKASNSQILFKLTR